MDFITQAQKIAIFDYLNEAGQITHRVIQEAEERTEAWVEVLTLEEILEAVTEVLFVPVKDIESPSRNFHINFARKCYYYLARNEGHTYSNVGARVNRDAQTVNKMVKTVGESIASGPAQDTYMLAALTKIQQVLAEKK